ncbi:class I SAM-dependent methyltransferase [Halorussus amylolyticus]|uniref:class I SAM-dependent methyltransferase n=1 Tax=Halorussus amylolyticus TaxID=1126242 RepID=UPI001046AC90|nr:class I SAM-dependent methyltransferase [Halorussus amylolyticus]
MDSTDVLERWANRSGEYSPDYYAHYGPNEASESIRARIDSAVSSDPAVLELGCSSGRHLAHLQDHGYENLHGIEINDDAFDVMEDAYPDLADSGTFYADAIENVVADFDDDRFDAVFSVETLQHLHPDHEWVFDELTRITDDVLVTVENEGGEGDTETDRREGDTETDRREGDTETDAETDDDPDVNYVNDDFPLYYRDWHRVFTERGFTEIGSESLKRDTLRAFRPT